MASYPSSVWSPTENTGTGQTIQTGYFQDPYNEVVAIEGGLLNGFQHTLKFASDNTYDFGASGANRPRNLYVGTSVIAPGANPAASGFLRFPNNPGAVLSIRNSGNTGDITVLSVDGSGNLTLGAGMSGLSSLSLTSYLAVGTNPAGAGNVRLPYAAGGIYFRNQANSADHQAMDVATVGASNVLAIATGNTLQGAAIGTANIATTATSGWPYIPTSAGAPTGTPGGVTGFSPFQYDDTNKRAYIYSGGSSAWMFAGLQTPQVQVYTTGSGTYTTPAGARALWVRIVGAGGGGGSGNGTNAGTGGAAGGYSESLITSPSASYAYAVGSGGGAAAGGGSTTFGSSFMTANGGGAGISNSSNNQGGAGGGASGGTVNISGSAGCSSGPSTSAGAGGSGAFGGGGQGNTGAGGAGSSGGGGGGAGNGTGGTGGNGLIIIVAFF